VSHQDNTGGEVAVLEQREGCPPPFSCRSFSFPKPRGRLPRGQGVPEKCCVARGWLGPSPPAAMRRSQSWRGALRGSYAPPRDCYCPWVDLDGRGGSSTQRRSGGATQLACALPGEVMHEDGDSAGPGQTRAPYDFFLSMFPREQLVRILRLPSAVLEGRVLRPTIRAEMLTVFGVIVFATRYESGSRAKLWSTRPSSPYLVWLAFVERTGVSRCHFDALRSCVAFSEQSSGGGDVSEQSRWELIPDFVDSINAYCDSHVSLSNSFALISRCARGMGRAVLGSNKDRPCTSLLTVSQNLAVRYKTRRAGGAGSCCGWAS